MTMYQFLDTQMAMDLSKILTDRGFKIVTEELHKSDSSQISIGKNDKDYSVYCKAKRPGCDDPPEVDALLPFLVPTESTEISSPSDGFSAGGITLHEDDLKSLHQEHGSMI
ncbi:hypothetical protein NHX12_016919, partial [Muraenolepis orangiensis]